MKIENINYMKIENIKNILNGLKNKTILFYNNESTYLSNYDYNFKMSQSLFY